MLRKALIRIIIALALTLLIVGMYSGLESDASSRILENVAEKAKNLGYTAATGSDHWDTVIDVEPLIERLESGDTDFDWAEWIDLDKIKMYEAQDLDPKLYPYLTELTYNEKPVMPYEFKTSPQEQAMLGRIYCKKYLSSPFRVVALQNPAVGKDQHLLVGEDAPRLSKPRQFKVQHVNPELRHRQFGHNEPTEYYEASEPLVTDLKARVEDVGIVNVTFPRLEEHLFDWDINEVLEYYDTSDHEAHSITIREGSSDLIKSPKHFYEVWIRDDPVGYGVHYDWRFFRRILPHDEQVAATHALARTWQQFAEEMGIAYWYAHGSLLGYMWNGMSMPWDNDHDIQMPIKELDRLARDFNRTLVVQHPSEGYRKYLVDVGPYYVQRVRGNGHNVIDARFIDVDSGVFIDITGLARTNSVRKMVGCKNRHYYRIEDFARARRTMFEGYSALVPVEYKPMLAKEYRRYATPIFKNWKFNPKVQLWEFLLSCADYMARYPGTIHIYCFPSDVRKDDGCQQKYGTCDKVVIDKYKASKDVTDAHSKELELLSQIAPITPHTNWDDHLAVVDKMLHILGDYHPPFRNSTMIDIDLAGNGFTTEETH